MFLIKERLMNAVRIPDGCKDFPRSMRQQIRREIDQFTDIVELGDSRFGE
jgi:hypothetical protein